MSDMPTLVFIGDSITDAGRFDDPEGRGRGYVRLIADALSRRGQNATIVNTGIGGHRVRDLRARWSSDALEHRPDVLTIYVGINDTWRRYDADDPTSADDFERDYRDILRQARDAGVRRLVLIQPFVTPVDEQQTTWGEDLDPKRDAISRLAAEFGADVVPLHEIMAAASANLDAGALAWDGVHPTPAGDRVIADAWLNVFDR
jgi:lysophospholipase L1-like esterase